MICKNCGTSFGKEAKREDEIYQCPGCGKLYRIVPKQAGGSRKVPAKKRKTKKKQRRSRLILIAAVALIAVIILVAVLLVRGSRPTKDAEAALLPENTPEASAAVVEATAEPTPVPTATPLPPASVRIRAVGDVMSHKLQLTHARQKDGSYNYDSQFEMVRDSLLDADLTIANLELSIGQEGDYTSFPYFKTPAAILDTLKDCGVDFLTMANNHILDGYWDGLIRTVDAVEERGFVHVGAYRTQEESDIPVLMDVNGIRFGFIAYTKDTNDNDHRTEGKARAYGVDYFDGADFAADVQALRDQGAEVVICLPHWGKEQKRSVPSDTRKQAEQLIAAGVDIILGSHPHVVLPVETVTVDTANGQRSGLVVWSMGNFISYMANQYVDSGIIAELTVDRDSDGTISVRDVGYVPVYVWGNKHTFHLVCSGEYLDQKPDGMSESDWKRMKKSRQEIMDMIGSGYAVLEK